MKKSNPAIKKLSLKIKQAVAQLKLMREQLAKLKVEEKTVAVKTKLKKPSLVQKAL